MLCFYFVSIYNTDTTFSSSAFLIILLLAIYIWKTQSIYERVKGYKFAVRPFSLKLFASH